LPRFDERKDKHALIRHVFAQEAAGAPSVSLGEDLVDALCAQPWPGNIRQLRNGLRAAIALRAGDRLELADLPFDSVPRLGLPDPGFRRPKRIRSTLWQGRSAEPCSGSSTSSTETSAMSHASSASAATPLSKGAPARHRVADQKPLH